MRTAGWKAKNEGHLKQSRKWVAVHSFKVADYSFFDTHNPKQSLPTADVGYPVAQLGGQLSGSEIARTTGAGRLFGTIRYLESAPESGRPEGITPNRE